MLIKMCEPVRLRKMGFSTKFPRKIACVQTSSLRIGLMKPSTMMEILALKSHLGHKRNGIDIAEMIEINEDNAHVQHGHKDHVVKIK